MSEDNFKKAFEFVIKWEGGYVDDPMDSGGATKFGISSKAYPHLDVKNLTIADAEGIYYKDFWLKAGCNNMEYPMNIVVFDTAVNCGVSQALRLYQESTDACELLIKRIKYYADITVRNPKNIRFFRGWINRVLNLYQYIKKEGKNE